MKALLLLGCLVAYANAHACLMYPIQRGSMRDLSVQGTDDCLRLNAPCGDQRPDISGNGITEFLAGQYVTMVFQKNKDHYNPLRPGYWKLSIAESENTTYWRTLYTATDTQADQKSGQMIYSVSVQIPNSQMDTAVVQLNYHTNNDEAPPDFYQCADVRIIQG